MRWCLAAILVIWGGLSSANAAAPPAGGTDQIILAVPEGQTVEVARVALPEFLADYEANKVIRRDHAGRILWATRLTGDLGSVRPPHLLADAFRVYVSHGDGVTALDRETGKVVWHAKGPGDGMYLGDGLLLAADCGNG